jgi:hypothetical protein
MRLPVPATLAALLLGMIATPAVAAPQAPAPGAPVNGPLEPEKVKQVIVYGDDPCPRSEGEEIVVCARLSERDRYRIPLELRSDPMAPQNQSWANRAKSIEYVGRSGTDSCSPVGGGGFTGCFAQIARAAKAERQALLGGASWADAVSAEREKRLSSIDADSKVIEAQVKAEEAAAARQSAPMAATTATNQAEDDKVVDSTPLPELKR